ncbi:hypothetical protein ACFQ5N_14125 [Lutibacter holmesii]|uniref:Uncharacterized protein n=1 Tax=Lutibacter holmesii TaxID=1137985 RepID=A0ABW3WSW4_9FLAO
MTKHKSFIIVIYLIISFFNSKTYSQIEHSNNELWLALKNSAHNIGFCVYNVQQEPCIEHLHIKNELEKISETPDTDINYFLLNPKWAKDRLTELSKNNNSKLENYIILFDIDQNSFKKLNDSTKTSNSYKMFSIFNLNNEFEFKTHRETVTHVTFFILSNTTSSILSNTMWREFMSNRLGRLDSKIEISLNGANAMSDYHKFKNSFINFVEK